MENTFVNFGGHKITVNEVKTYTATGVYVFSGYNPTIYKYGRLCYLPIIKVISRFPTSSDTVGTSGYIYLKIPNECAPTGDLTVHNGHQVQLVNSDTPRAILAGTIAKASTNEYVIGGVVRTIDNSGYASNDRIQGCYMWLTD